MTKKISQLTSGTPVVGDKFEFETAAGVSNQCDFSVFVSSYDPAFVPGTFSNWTTAKARGSTNPARMLFIGDSNGVGEGQGASGTNLLVGAATTNLARKFGNLLGYQITNFFGDQNITASASGVTAPSYDSRIAFGTGWASDSAVDILGGRFFIASSGSSSDRITFSPGTSINKFRIWWPRTAGITTNSTVYVDGSSVGTIDMTGANSIQSTTFSVSSGVHTIALGRGSANAYCGGIECWDGSSTPVFLQGSSRGLTSTDMAKSDNAWSHHNGALAVAPDYCIIYCTINDINAGTALQTYYANVEKVVAALKAQNCDGCLVFGFPANSTAMLNGSGDAFATVVRNIAADYGWTFYDSRRVFGRSYTKATALGYNYNANHPNATGGTAIANALYAALGPSL